MLGRRARGDRRLRERGRPAWATVTGATPAGEGVWRLALRVEPSDRDAFEAHADLPWAGPGDPPVGGTVEVLHDGRRDRVMVLGWPSRPPVPEPPPPGPGPAPDIGAVIRAVVRAAGDGSLRRGTPIVLRDDGDDPPPG